MPSQIAESLRPEISCRVTLNLLTYFESVHGNEALLRACAKLDSALPIEYFVKPKNWVSFAFAARLLDALADESGDPLFARKAGSHVVTRESLGFVYYMLGTLSTPAGLYSQITNVGAAVNKVGSFQIESRTNRRLVLRYRSNKPEPNKRLCDARIGQIAALPTIWGLPEAEVREHRCQVNGDDDCLYEFTWLAVSRAPQLLGPLGGISGGVAGLVFGDPTAAAFGTTAGMLVGIVLGRWLEARRGLFLAAANLDSIPEREVDFTRTMTGPLADRSLVRECLVDRPTIRPPGDIVMTPERPVS